MYFVIKPFGRSENSLYKEEYRTDLFIEVKSSNTSLRFLLNQHSTHVKLDVWFPRFLHSQMVIQLDKTNTNHWYTGQPTYSTVNPSIQSLSHPEKMRMLWKTLWGKGEYTGKQLFLLLPQSFKPFEKQTFSGLQMSAIYTILYFLLLYKENYFMLFVRILRNISENIFRSYTGTTSENTDFHALVDGIMTSFTLHFLRLT